jgi:hypothetical protein
MAKEEKPLSTVDKGKLLASQITAQIRLLEKSTTSFDASNLDLLGEEPSDGAIKKERDRKRAML